MIVRTLLRPLALVLLCAALFAPLSARAADVPRGIAIGSALPHVVGVDLSEQSVDVNRFLGAKTLVISFWSIYCSDCVRELDDLRAMRSEFSSEDVEIIAVNTDSAIPVARIASFVRRYEGARGASLGVVHMLDRDNSIVKAFGVTQIPLLITVDRSGMVTNVVGGYDPTLDRPRLLQALQQGAVTLGNWSGQIKSKLRTLLRETGPGGKPYEAASYRVEEAQALFGWRNAAGWIVPDPSDKNARDEEKKRIEKVVADRLKLNLMRSALATVGIQTPEPLKSVYDRNGISLPESPFVAETRWTRLYRTLAFDEMFITEARSALWVGEEYNAGLVANVDLDKLKTKLEYLSFTAPPVKLKLVLLSDYDFKSRAVLQKLKDLSWRFYTLVDETLTWHGTADDLVNELGEIKIPGLTIYAEIAEDGKMVRIEVY